MTCDFCTNWVEVGIEIHLPWNMEDHGYWKMCKPCWVGLLDGDGLCGNKDLKMRPQEGEKQMLDKPHVHRESLLRAIETWIRSEEELLFNYTHSDEPDPQDCKEASP